MEAMVGFGLLVGGLVFAAFRALNDGHTRAMVSAEVKAREYVAEAKVRALESEMAAMKRIAAAEAVALERIKAAQGPSTPATDSPPMTPATYGVLPVEVSAPPVSGFDASGTSSLMFSTTVTGAEEGLDPRTIPDPDQDGIDDKHIRMMDGFVYPKSDFQNA